MGHAFACAQRAIPRAPRYEAYEVPHTPRMRITDVLDYVHENMAVDFGYRWLCGSKKCGTCAVNVNGSPKLACWDEAELEMTIEPLSNMQVIRDLVTSRDAFEALLARLSPMLVRKAEYRGFPEPLTAIQLAPTAHLRDCIQCLACQSVCPMLKQPDSCSRPGAASLLWVWQPEDSNADRGRPMPSWRPGRAKACEPSLSPQVHQASPQSQQQAHFESLHDCGLAVVHHLPVDRQPPKGHHSLAPI